MFPDLFNDEQVLEYKTNSGECLEKYKELLSSSFEEFISHDRVIAKIIQYLFFSSYCDPSKLFRNISDLRDTVERCIDEFTQARMGSSEFTGLNSKE